MKKVLALVLAFAMVFSTITVAFADTEVSKEAKALATLGMLEGDGNGVTVEYTAKELTRLGAAAALLKLKGLYDEAVAFKGEDNFADVKDYAWVEGRNLMAYLKANPGLGFGGDEKGNFNPGAMINEQSYYKVLLETLGYKQTTSEVAGDFAWEEVFDFAEKVGLKPAKAEKFTIDELAKATFAALNAKTKDGKVYVDTLIAAGVVTEELAVAAGVKEEAPALAVAVDTVKAIGNTIVEVVFEDDVDAAVLENAEYAIDGLEISEVVVSGTDRVRLTTAAMTAGKVYTLTVGEEAIKFAGIAAITGAPKLDKVAGTDEQTVELTFDKVLDFASATNVENYAIANVTVVKAEVDGKVVTLTTEGLVANKTYTVKVTNIESVDGGLLKSASKTFVARTDKTAPKVEKVEALTNTRVLVVFNENVTVASATNVANYKIMAGDEELAIEAIEMVQDSKNSVEITTAPQKSGKKYELTVNNIVDRKVLANTMTKETKKTFYGKAEDKIAPTLKSMTYLSKNLILVEFNETSRLDVATAIDVNNYEMNNDITVDAVRMKDADNKDCKSVILEVSEMTLNKNYKLTVSNVADEYGNVMKETYKTKTLVSADLAAARVDSVKAYDKTVVITFTKELNEASAEDISTYSIDEEVGVPVKAVYESKNGVYKVTLTTGVELKAGKSYELTIANLEDLAGSIINVKPTFMASATSIDTEKPVVEYIEMLNKNVVAVTFSEPMKVGGNIFVNVGTNRSNDQQLTAVDSNEDGTVLYFVNATKTPLNIAGATNNQLNVFYASNATPAVVSIKDKAGNLLDISADALADEYKVVEINEEPIDTIVFEGAEQVRVNRFKLIFSGKIGDLQTNATLSVSGDSSYVVITPDNVNYDTVNDDRTVVYVDYNSNFKPDKTYRLDLTGFKGLLGEPVEGEGVTSDTKKQYVDLYAGMEDDLAPYIESVTALTRTKIEIKYNEELKGSQSMSFEIRDEDDKVFATVTGSTTANSKKVTLTLVGKELEAGKAYTLIAKGQFRDLSGNASEKGEEFSFEGTNVVTANYVTVNQLHENVLEVALYEGTINYITVTGGQGSYAVNEDVYEAGDVFTVSKPLYEGVTYTVKVNGNSSLTTTFEGLVSKPEIVVDEDAVIAKIVIAEESKTQADKDAAQAALDDFSTKYASESGLSSIVTPLQARITAITVQP